MVVGATCSLLGLTMVQDCQNAPKLHCDNSLPIYMQIMYIYILAAIIVLGTFGNVVAVMVFMAQRNEKSSKTRTLLICLGIADTLYLLSSIFTRLLPTLSTYVYFGERLSWSIFAKPYATAVASMLQTFATYMVLVVIMQRYVLVTKPITFTAYFSAKRLCYIISGIAGFSVVFNIIRFFELHVEVKCKDCLGVALPLQTRTDLGMNLYFNIIYTIVLRIIFRGMIPIVGVAILTKKLSVVSILTQKYFNIKLLY